MFFDDHKKAITTMISKRSDKGEPMSGPTPMKAEVVKEEDGSMDGRHAAAQDMMAAYHEKSPAKLMEALANFMDIHNARDMSGEDAGDESPS